MNTNAIRDLAVSARHQLMEGVERRCLLFDVYEGAATDADSVDGRVLSSVEKHQRAEFVRLLAELSHGQKPGAGMAQLVERAAYTWFNRLFAIRFMEANDRLPSHVRMLSAPDGSFAPECLREAMDLPLESLDMDEVAELVASGDDEGLFRAILLAQCDELAGCMPAVFERVSAAMGLLLPDGLLAPGGVVELLVTAVPEDDWREGVEIVGWAYQFYVSERKDEFFKSKRKAGADDIAPATQLFTPEYIVRFLVQNSLGRLWVLNNPGSALAGSMEYFIASDPGSHEDFRRISSPEEVTLVDPACGSGHFLCYAFDLLAAMYEERGYRRRDIPRLILEKNVTGVEIDPRAAALTAFALTMKACELDVRFLRRAVAPKVTCLEPVSFTPDEKQAMGATEEHQSLLELLEHLGEVGSLWAPTPNEVDALEGLRSAAQSSADIFAARAADKICRTLSYAKTLSATKDVCVTNPPYMGSGNLAPWMLGWVKKAYPNEKADLCTCFIARGFSLARKDGYNAQVTMQSWMFLSSFEKMRKDIIANKGIVCMAHLGARAFDAIGGEVVQTAATVFHNAPTDSEGVYLRLVDLAGEAAKERAIREALADNDCGWRFEASASNFQSIPGWPIAYWASGGVRSAYRSFPPLASVSRPRQGLATADNDRFLRLWWETSFADIGFGCSSTSEAQQTGLKWFPMTKGGEFRRWYGNLSYVVNWKNDGYEIKNFVVDGKQKSRPQNLDAYFKPGLSWTAISTGDFAMRLSFKGIIPNAKGPICVADTETQSYVLLAATNSTSFMRLISFVSPTLDYSQGPLSNVPVPLIDNKNGSDAVACMSAINISRSKMDWDAFETSWDFTSHPPISTLPDEGPEVFLSSEFASEASVSERLRIPLVPPNGTLLSAEYARWENEAQSRFNQLKANEEELNRIFARIYHMEGEVPIEASDDKVSVRRADLGRDVRSLISYAVGCMFGRYSLDKPGLVLANQGDGLPEYLAQVPNPTFMPDADGILPVTDDEYFEDDIVALFCAWLKAAYGSETLDENLRFVADALGGKGTPRKVIRNYFMNEFFRDHCTTYSVPSAGKRPIYWLVDSGRRGGFRALVYMHRYTPDLLARVRTDYVHERQERYRSHIAELEDAHTGATKREQAIIDRELRNLRAQLEEVNAFEERLHHLADQMIEIDLDDGFKVNYAKFSDIMAKVR